MNTCDQNLCTQSLQNSTRNDSNSKNTYTNISYGIKFLRLIFIEQIPKISIQIFFFTKFQKEQIITDNKKIPLIKTFYTKNIIPTISYNSKLSRKVLYVQKFMKQRRGRKRKKNQIQKNVYNE